MAVVIHFKDGTTLTNSNWQNVQEAAPNDGHFINMMGGGTPGAILAFVPTCIVQYVDLNG